MFGRLNQVCVWQICAFHFDFGFFRIATAFFVAGS
jgi:hypothetical protein